MRLPSRLDWESEAFCDIVFAIVLSISFALRIFLLAAPEGTLIFDEYYYVNSARVILGLPQSPGETGAPPYLGASPGIDPNREHPPLAKLLIALSMRLLGDNAYGWRMPSVLLAILSIIAFYELLKRNTGSPRVSLLGSFLYAFDSLGFVHSRIATLDIYALALLILGFLLYLRGQPVLSGMTMALSILCKETALLGAVALATYVLLQEWATKERWSSTERAKHTRARHLLPLGVFACALGATFLGLLFVLDNLWGAFRNPIDHISYIYRYASGLVSAKGPSVTESYPWEWLLNQVQIPYLKVNVNVSANGQEASSYTTILFVGAMNPFIIFLTIPAVVYQAYLWKCQGKTYSLFLLAWFTLTYLPYYPLALIGHRVMYIFYFLNTIPAVCGAVALMVADSRLPKVVVLAYALSVVAGFIAFFPFRGACRIG